MPSLGLCSRMSDISLQKVSSVHCNVEGAMKQKLPFLDPTVLLQLLLSVLLLDLFGFCWLGWVGFGLGFFWLFFFFWADR